jgi:hypothetical protein
MQANWYNSPDEELRVRKDIAHLLVMNEGQLAKEALFKALWHYRWMDVSLSWRKTGSLRIIPPT